jgi:hypothetical protein
MKAASSKECLPDEHNCTNGLVSMFSVTLFHEYEILFHSQKKTTLKLVERETEIGFGRNLRMLLDSRLD